MASQPKKGAIWRARCNVANGRSEKAEKQPSKACLLLHRVSALAKPELPEFSCKIKKKKKTKTQLEDLSDLAAAFLSLVPSK